MSNGKAPASWWSRNLERRVVLKGMGVAAALGTVASNPLARAQDIIGVNLDAFDKVSTSHWSGFVGHVRGGRLTHVTPVPQDPDPTPMIQGLPDLLYSTNRVKYPMIRKGFYQDRHNSDPTKRGAEPFVRVSWDEALDIVAEQIQRVQGSYGNEAIYAGSYGWQSAGAFHGASTALHRFLGLVGGYVDLKGNYSWEIRPIIMPYVIGASTPDTTTWPTIIDNSTLVVAFGLAGIKNNEMNRGGVNYNADYIRALKAKGTPVVSINPIHEQFDEFLGTERHAIRPNTDTALMLGLMHTLYSEKLHDQAFLDTYTQGFDKFLPYLTGDSDGQPKSAEWAAAITEIDADTIRQLARRMADNRTIILTGASLQRADHGEQPEWAIVALASMLGQVGQPGGGFMFPAVLAYAVPRGVAPAVPGLPAGKNPVDTYVPVSRFADAFRNPGKTVTYNGSTVTYPDVKLVYWAGGNPFHHQMNTNAVLEAWQKPEVTIVNEYSWTATAKHADIVLPATTTMERNDIQLGRDSRFIFAMPKFVDPLFEARDDFQIFEALAERFGVADQFTEGKSEMDWIRQFYDVAREQGNARGLGMPDFDTFWEQGYLEFDLDPAQMTKTGYADFRADPALNPIGTPSGKIEIYSEQLASYALDDCSAHPSWIEPTEWLGSAMTQQYPFHVLASHPKYRLHSQLANTYLRHLYEIGEREPVWINPQDAEKLGIQTGDIVRVFNDRGQLLAGAYVTDWIRTGVLKISEGGWYDPQEPGVVGTLDKHGSYNTIGLDKPASQLSQANCGDTTLAQIEKFTGAVPRVTAWDPPAGEI